MGVPVLITGLVISALGLVLMALEHFGFPRLPGDIFIQKGNVTFYFPIVTMLLISIVITVIVNLLKK